MSGPSEAVTLRAAIPGDMGRISDLLRQCELPTEDLPTDGRGFVVALDRGRIVGVGALEQAAESTLLRSVAVDPHHRGAGTARALCEELLREATRTGTSRVYLLTTDAASYFAALGFHEVPRESAPEGIRATQEYSHLCPGSATLMMHDLAFAEDRD